MDGKRKSESKAHQSKYETKSIHQKKKTIAQIPALIDFQAKLPFENCYFRFSQNCVHLGKLIVR